jgi:hypothetical protein
MLLLQIAEQVAERAFTLSPDTIYMFLVGILVLANIAQGVAIVYLYKQNQKLTDFVSMEMSDMASSIERVLERSIK